jgi:predicted transcriptional regulator
MALTKPEVKALVEIYSGRSTLSGLSETLQLSLSSISLTVQRLVDKHLCQKKRKGKSFHIEPSQSAAGEAFRNLIVARKPFGLEAFLFGLRFRVLSLCLYEAKTTEQMAGILQVSRKSIQNILYPLCNRQLLHRQQQKYLFFRKGWPKLFAFLHAYRMFSPAGEVLWKFEREQVFLVREPQHIQGRLTGFTAYGEYGITLRPVTYCCFLPERKLSKVEIFLHSLLEIKDDTRFLDLAIVFYRKQKLKAECLMKLAPQYDLVQKVRDFLSIMRSRKEKIQSETLPVTSQRGIRDMMALYQV